MNFYKLIPYTNSILFCFIFSACVIEKTKTGIAIYKKKNEKSTPEGFSIMKNGRFKLKNKFRLSDSTLLSITNVYKVSCNEGSEWYKFYENGRVLHANVGYNAQHLPFAIGFTCGYYTLKGNNIKIEMSELATFAFGDSYDRKVTQGKITGDTIKFYKDQWGGRGRNIMDYSNWKNKKGENCYFIKSEKSPVIGQPRW